MEKQCEEKNAELMTCAGEETVMKWGEKCEEVSSDTATCCPIIPKLIECLDSDCMTISMAMQKMKADAGDADEKKELESTADAREACPDAGIPTADAISATATEGKVISGGGGGAATSDFAAPGQTVSLLAMAAALAASLMA